MDNVKKRINWIDMAKGYGIILVIVGHLNLDNITLFNFNINIGTIIFNWIYSFHMPLFFFLSGFVFSAKLPKEQFIYKKIKTMIIPYFCLGGGIICYKMVLCIYEKINLYGKQIFLNYKIIIDELSYIFKTNLNKLILQERTFTLWFLACLFFLEIIFYIILKKFKKDRNVLLISVLLFSVGILNYNTFKIILPWNIDTCLTAVLYFCLGFLLKKNYGYFEQFLNKPLLIALISLPINILSIFLNVNLFGSNLEMFCNKYNFLPLTLISSFAGILFIISVSRIFTISPIAYIGKNSLLYFAWHQSIMIDITEMILSKLSFNTLLPTYAYIVVEVIFILIMCTLCNFSIDNTFLRFIIGKPIKK